jgi:hypothetical protein
MPDKNPRLLDRSVTCQSNKFVDWRTHVGATVLVFLKVQHLPMIN